MFQHRFESSCNLDDLLAKIDHLKKELNIIALSEGFNSIRTLMLSQELDVYIVKYQRCKK